MTSLAMKLLKLFTKLHISNQLIRDFRLCLAQLVVTGLCVVAENHE